MTRRLLIMGTGTGASNNLIRSLRRGDPASVIVGCHQDRFVLKQSTADRNYLIPPSTHPDLLNGLRRVIEAERIDVLLPNSDADVAIIATLRAELPCHTFVPSKPVIELCQDKYDLAEFLRSRGVPVPLTYLVTDVGRIGDLFERLASQPRVWCRLRTGASSMGAIPVSSPEQARSWIQCWQEMRGVPTASFTISEYLPGRDFAVQSLWNEGRLILIKTIERLSYLGGLSQVSGTSSLAALAKTVFEPRVVDVCAAAVRAVDPRASGAFSLDLKENALGVPCITEINVGRLLTGTNLFDFVGDHNMALTYVRLACGEPINIAEPYDACEGYYMVRDFDTPPGIFHADELFIGINDARS